MSQITDFFKPEVLFSSENPLLKSVEDNHRRAFEAFDKAARVQLSYTEDLLDLNRKRFDAQYGSGTVSEKLSAYQDLATEIGQRTATWAGDLQEAVFSVQNDAANEQPAKAKKAKAAA